MSGNDSTPVGGQPQRETAPAGEYSGLTALATRRPVAVLMIVLTVLTFGMISLERLPRSLMPDISYPSITVRTEYPGASPVDVEQRISRRLEEVLAQTRNLRRITSVSRAEASDIILEFDWDTTMSSATGDVRERIEQAFLPLEATKPLVLRYDPSLDPVVQVGLYTARRQETQEGVEDELIRLRLLADDLVRRERRWGRGVAAVQARGGLEREIRIEVEASELKAHGVTMELVNQRLKDENLNQASGILYEGDQAYVVRTANEFLDLNEIRQVILNRTAGVPLRLEDVAQVRSAYAEPEVLTRIDGHPCVKLEFYKEGDANLVEVARGIRERIFGTPQEQEQLRHYEARRRQPAAAAAEPSDDDSKKKTTDGKNGKQIRLGRPDFLMATLPEDVRVEVMSDQSIFIQRALDEVRQTALVGGVLAIFVLYLFLRNAWFTLAVGLAIPISVIASFIALHLYDVSINMMSLGGIALGIGMLVDTSIVVLESIFRCQQEGDSPLRAAVRGTREVTGAVVASTLTTVCVFLPIIFVEGIAGQVFRDQALAVVISLVASLLVALYFLPTLVCHRPGHRSLHGGEPSMRDTDLGFRFRALARLRTRAADLRGRYCRLGNVAKVALAPCALLVPLLLFAVFLVRLLLELLGWLGTILFAAAVALGRGIGATLGRALSAPTTRVLHVWEAGFLRLAAAYERVLAYSLRHRPAVVLLVLLAAAGAFYCFTRLGSELIPQVHQGEFTAELRMPLGTRLERTDRVLMPLERRMLEQAQLLGIDSLTTTVGVEKDSIHAGDEGEHTARFLVRMRSGQNPQQVENHVKARFREILRSEAAVAGVRFRNPVLFSFKTPIEVEIRGYDLEALRRITRQVDSTLREVAALKDVTNNATTGYPEAHLHFDRDLLNRHGLTVTDVAERLRHMVQGDVPSYFSEGDRKVEMRARLREEDRDSLEELSRLVLTPEGAAAVTLRDVLLDSTGRVEVTEGPSEIRRIGGQRAGVVTANLIGMDLGHVVEQVETAVSRVKHPPDFTVGFGGQKKEMDLSIAQLRQAFLLAVFLVYVVMAVQFESLLQPLVILLAVPLAMLGVSPALWFLETPLSIVVFLGMIVLAGIVVNNAIVLISYVNQMRAQGVPLESALAAAGKIRLRPILMTTLTTILGLLPLTGLFQQIPAAQSLLGVGEGAEVRAPMAITVIAGLTASTLLTLVVVPVFYSMVARDTHHGPLDPGDAEGCSDG